jgi:hypothetical protein
MNTPTGISSTTKTVRTSRRRTGSVSFEGGFCTLKASMRETPESSSWYLARFWPPV